MTALHRVSKTNPTMKLSREFDCWRGLEFGEQYTCVVEVLADGRVRLDLDIITFSVSPQAAGEIANCLDDALAYILGQGDQQQSEERAQSSLTASYMTGMRGLQYVATGEIHVSDASPDFFEDSNQGHTPISICSIPGGGYELVFDFMCYSFSAQDAIWLSSSLLEACEQTEALDS